MSKQKVLAVGECCHCGDDVEIETDAKQIEDEETAELLPDWGSLEEEEEQEPCPCCGETDHCGVFTCLRCNKPACDFCCCMHFGCEAEENGGIYIGPEQELPR